MSNVIGLRRRAPLPAFAVICVASLLGCMAGTGWHYAKPFLDDTSPAPTIVLRGTASGDSGRAVVRRKAAPPRSRGTAGGFSGRVVRIVDGDSFRMDCCGEDIRLWGIDAPEWNGRGGPAAAAALRTLVAGRSLSCRKRDADRYGRIVGQCALEDGSDLGRRLLQTGTVREYCFFSRNHYGTC
jgi:endonuclease YncB( thermonuclease family)